MPPPDGGPPALPEGDCWLALLQAISSSAHSSPVPPRRMDGNGILRMNPVMVAIISSGNGLTDCQWRGAGRKYGALLLSLEARGPRGFPGRQPLLAAGRGSLPRWRPSASIAGRKIIVT
ncbi:MAG: hypothetical protein AMXMBFR45_10850 [Gammaproteobacteria bacterium]|nr:MAG: hypothetical protein BroJett010_11940 [Gammaproteobacteria bacterium]